MKERNEKSQCQTICDNVEHGFVVFVGFVHCQGKKTVSVQHRTARLSSAPGALRRVHEICSI